MVFPLSSLTDRARPFRDRTFTHFVPERTQRTQKGEDLTQAEMLAGQHAGLKGFRQNLDDMLDLDIGAFSATNTVPQLHDTSRTGRCHAICTTRHYVFYFAGLDFLG